MDFIVAAILALFLYGIYNFVTLNNDYFRERGVAHMKPTFLFGNMIPFLFRGQWFEFAKTMYTAFPRQKIIGMFDMRQPFFCVRDPDILKQLAVKDFDHFEDHRMLVDEKVDALFGNSLICLRGTKWRDMRATLSPAFTGSKMRQMFELVAECAYDASSTIKKMVLLTGGYVDCDMKDLFTKMTNDVISSTAFGHKINSFEDPTNDFYLAGKQFMKFSSPLAGVKFLVMLLLPKIATLLDINFSNTKVMNFFRSMVLRNMESRTKQRLFRPDMINILMNVRRGKTDETQTAEENNSEDFAATKESTIGSKIVKRVWTDDELAAQCFLFFLAGFDTTSSLLSFLSHELTMNPGIQQKLYDEVRQTFDKLNGQRLTYDMLQQMKYMDACICEGLRHWPPAATTDRMCVKDYDYDDGQVNFKIKKGQYFVIPIYGIHHDDKYWTNPHIFDPERFSEENRHKINTNAYIPFGLGSRSCIGSRFALMEVKAIVFYLLLYFRLLPNDQTQTQLKLLKTPFSLRAEKGINVRLKLREPRSEKSG